MSGVHATQPLIEEATPGVEAYLDTLYEIVATGVEPVEGASLERIEAFLHEHARADKSLVELQAFFTAHRLSVRPPGEARAGLRMIDPIPSVEPPPEMLPEPAAAGLADTEDTTQPSLRTASPLPTRAPVAAAPSALFLGVVGLLLLGAGAACSWGYLTLTQLRSELSRLQAQATDTGHSIVALERQATEMRLTVGESHELLQRFERNNDALLDAVLPAPVVRP